MKYPNNITPSLILLAILSTTTTQTTLKQYQQLQIETPQLIFEQMQGNFMKQQTINIKKLIFITPWNKRGNYLVTKYSHKFDYVSPCWYELTLSKDHIIIKNDQLYNDTFIKQLRKNNPNIKILPRFYIGNNQQAVLKQIGSFKVKFQQSINLIKKIIQTYKFDGLVWDSPFNTFIDGQKYKGVRNLIANFVNSIKMNLPNNKLLFFNMANPMGTNLANQMYRILNVDCIMIQNYDNDHYIQMIEASINWAQSTKFNKKPIIMLLLPFFARRGGEGVDAKQIQQIYKTKGQLGATIQKNICCFYEYETRIQSYVPCYVYFKKVLKMIQDQGFAAGFWEAGNGLDNYYNFI